MSRVRDERLTTEIRAYWYSPIVGLAMSDDCIPILRLPNEILVEIAAAGQRADWESQPDDLFTTELTLSHLCRRFRHAITSAPELWTRVYIDLSSLNSIHLSRLYLERSATRKISVTLCAPQDITVPHASTHSELVPCHQHITRISRLYIEFGSYFDLRTALATLGIHGPGQSESDSLDGAELPPAPFPCLQHLELEYLSQVFNHTNYDLPEEFFAFDAPQLASLALTRCSVHSCPPWMSALTRVELRHGAALVYPGSDIFEDVTMQLPALTHLRADLKELYYSFEHGIVSNCLTDLQLRILDDYASGPYTLLRIFSSFNTPALAHLVLYGTHGDQIAELVNSTSMNHPESEQVVFPALTSLSFITRSTGDLAVCREKYDLALGLEPQISISSPAARIFPALVSLTLVHQCFTPCILRQTLGRSSSESSPWPSLRTVALWPRKRDLRGTQMAMREILRLCRGDSERERAVPKFRLRPELFEWARDRSGESGVEVELVEKVADLSTSAD